MPSISYESWNDKSRWPKVIRMKCRKNSFKWWNGRVEVSANLLCDLQQFDLYFWHKLHPCVTGFDLQVDDIKFGKNDKKVLNPNKSGKSGAQKWLRPNKPFTCAQNQAFSKFDLPWWPLRHFEKPQVFHLNTEMVIKRGFSVFWWWLCKVLLYVERPLEKFERPFQFLKTP